MGKQALIFRNEALHKNRSFLIWVFSVDLRKSAGDCGFGHIYWKNLYFLCSEGKEKWVINCEGEMSWAKGVKIEFREFSYNFVIICCWNNLKMKALQFFVLPSKLHIWEIQNESQNDLVQWDYRNLWSNISGSMHYPWKYLFFIFAWRYLARKVGMWGYCFWFGVFRRAQPCSGLTRLTKSSFG